CPCAATEPGCEGTRQLRQIEFKQSKQVGSRRSFIHIRRLVRQSPGGRTNEREGVTMLNQYSPDSRSRLRRAITQSAVSAALLLAFTVTAAAYTLVFRDGRRVEIPDDFTVTRTTVTYEVSPGFSKTVLVALLDIRATERANNEAAGYFFKHRQ